MDQAEAAEQTMVIKKEKVQKELQKLKQRKVKYNQLQEQLNHTEETQISTTDADSRALPLQGNVVSVSYNVQSAVDAKHNLIVVCETTNESDGNALAPMALNAKAILQVEELTILADKGYHHAGQIAQCESNHITPVVAYGESNNSSQHMQEAYYTEQFVYDAKADTYICPEGHVLGSTGNWHEKKRANGTVSYCFKKYRTSYCSQCAVKHLCTGRAKGGREIERSEYQDAVDRNHQRVQEQKELYLRRQAIVEHPFGTIKRSWGYSYTLVKGLKKVGGEMALIFLVYNMRRAITLLGVKDMTARVKTWKPDYKKALCLLKTVLIRLILRPIEPLHFLQPKIILREWAA
jgi:Transposase DDE domain